MGAICDVEHTCRSVVVFAEAIVVVGLGSPEVPGRNRRATSFRAGIRGPILPGGVQKYIITRREAVIWNEGEIMWFGTQDT